MPDIPTLYCAEPLAISATYDKLWVREIVIASPTVGGDAEARVTLVRFRSTEPAWRRHPPSRSGCTSATCSREPTPIPTSRRRWGR